MTLQKQTPLKGWKRALVSVGAISALIGGIGSIAGGAWLGVQLIVNPEAVLWLPRFLPEWAEIPVDDPSAPQTLDAIRKEILQQNLIPADALSLFPKDGSAPKPDLLLPVMAERSACDSTCHEVVELRVYQAVSEEFSPSDDGTYYYLVDRTEVSGPAESFVIAPLSNANSASVGSTRPLSLSTLEHFEKNTPSPGIWLNLKGERMQGETRMLYGQIYHYNRDRTHLNLMLQWTSTVGKMPKWQEFTGGKEVELLVDGTVGLEPQFNIYQLQPRDFLLHPFQLTPISLAEPAIDSRTYKNALFLARNSLWSPALTILETLKPQMGKDWSPAAQAQMDLIAHHARVTQKQADGAWANPSQAVLAALIDGRWEQALQVFENNPEDRATIVSMLKTDQGRLWNRVEAAMRVNAAQETVKVWGTLIFSAQHDRAKALEWLRKQSNNSYATNQRIMRLLAQLEAVR